MALLQFALVQNNQVQEIISSSSAFAATLTGKYQHVVPLAGANIQPIAGDSYDGTNFTSITANHPKEFLVRSAIVKLVNPTWSPLSVAECKALFLS